MYKMVYEMGKNLLALNTKQITDSVEKQILFNLEVSE